MDYEICKGNYKTLGMERHGAITTFSIQNTARKKCTLVLYPENGENPVRIPMQADEDYTSVYSVGLKNLPPEGYDYLFELDDIPVLDPYAKCITGREQWGDAGRKESEVKCHVPKQEKFPWGSDRLPLIPKRDMVMYKLHVRGFTQLAKLPEEEKGTLKGIERKLSYLQELGITTLEFMPVYEFEEMFAKDPFQQQRFAADKINYWGYTRGNYFAVKASYLGTGNTAKSLKQLIRKMHQRNMECILEFYFDDKLNPQYILDVLHYWAEEYHADGFHVICSREAAGLIAGDYRLGGRKLFFEWFSEEQCEAGHHEMELFSYNDGFLYAVRKIMNHPEGSLLEFADQMKRQHRQQGFVNCLATNNGFCLYDSFSYTEKRNQENGEDNRDGIIQNFSSNCGEEGTSRKRQVNQLREKQIKNALCTLLFAQGIPLIWMGDESGNSQNGNNNAYCQDNETGWKDWSISKMNREILSFFQKLTALRKKYPVLRNSMPVEMSDYKRIGYPDLSYHGDNGWLLNMNGSGKTIGMMYACGYGEETGTTGDDFLYIGYNFSIADRILALPVLPPGYHWHYVLDTGREEAFREEALETGTRTFCLQGQSVCMLAGRKSDCVPTGKPPVRGPAERLEE